MPAMWMPSLPLPAAPAPNPRRMCARRRAGWSLDSFMGVPQLPDGQQSDDENGDGDDDDEEDDDSEYDNDEEPGCSPWSFTAPAGTRVIGYCGRAGPHVGCISLVYAAAMEQ